ncbi:mitochondrial carrier domain-containing protein [Pavlovales sp. CCMP2436]|nr:mitochondrial carrier domain-containing protein [Pavlovales sp. CCMP2436]
MVKAATEPTPVQKAASAVAGAVITSLTVTPFDVVKTRQQLWEAPAALVEGAEDALCCVKERGARPVSLALCNRCDHYETFHGGLGEELRPKGRAAGFWRPPPPALAGYPLNTLEMCIAIARHEGVSALWQGLGPALTMSLPATVLYMTAYDELRTRFARSEHPVLSTWAPMVAGVSARSFAAAVVSPIELIRTQMQSGQWESGLGLVGGLLQTKRRHGFFGLYRGLVPTLLRDIPFSGIYWTLYETGRTSARRHELSPFAASFASGAGAGMVASCVTTPFDVVKTRMQIALYLASRLAGPGAGGGREAQVAGRKAEVQAARQKVSAWATLTQIVRDDGVSALTSGMTTRMMKVAPACAIMVSSYEMGKRFFSS